MPKLTEFKILPYKAIDIYYLVMDIEKYPEFLPWCKKAQIIENISDKNLRADLVINFKAFSEKYRSDVHYFMEDGVYVIESRAISGPFKDLYSKWKISSDLDDQGNEICNVEFFISFKFNSIILDKMIGGIFEKASHKMISCFEERARELYLLAL